MITLDSRTGSGDLIHYLRQIAEVSRLEYGDAMISGEGPEGVPVAVGVEIKILSDLLKCITDGRFAGHQLPGLINSYQVIYLLIEGEWRRNFNSGILETKLRRGQWVEATVGTRRFMWCDLDRWLMTMEIKGGVRVRFTRERQETAQFLKDLHRWWEEGWAAHKSHLAFNESDVLSRPSELRDRALLVRPSLVRMLAKELPGVGWERSKEVERTFKTPMEMIEAGEKQWAAIKGIGKVTAKKVYEALRRQI